MRLLLGPTTSDRETILEVRPGTQTQDPKSGSQELIPGTRLRSGIQDSRPSLYVEPKIWDLDIANQDPSARTFFMHWT